MFINALCDYNIVSLRLKSIKNIQKITKSMKMVAAAKFGKAEKDLKFARPYGSAAASKIHTHRSSRGNSLFLLNFILGVANTLLTIYALL